MENFIDIKFEKNVATITINNNKTKNTMDSIILNELSEKIKSCEDNENIKAIIITGSGKSFISGISMKELALTEETDGDNFQKMQKEFNKINECSKPIIAAINGMALGIGFDIALAADIVIATESAKFAYPEISMSFIPCFGNIDKLVKTIGKGKALEMLLTGRAMDAVEAEKAGIVSRIVPYINLMEDVQNIGARIVDKSSQCIEAIMKLANIEKSENKELEKAYGRICLKNNDFKESIKSFKKKL